MEKRIASLYSIDIIKLILSVLVVLRHCAQFFLSPETVIYKIISNVIALIIVPLFFCFSGYLFFKKDPDSDRLKKYIGRIFKLYLIWSIIYLPVSIISEIRRGCELSQIVLTTVQKFLFDGVYFHLWYLASLIVGILIVFFLSRRMKNSTLLIIGILLHIIGTFVDTYSFVSDIFSFELYKSLFITTRNGLFFATLFVAIGKLTADGSFGVLFSDTRKRRAFSAASLLLFLVEGYFLAFVFNVRVVNMTFSSVLLAVAVMGFVSVHESKASSYPMLRKMSTLIYLIHPILIIAAVLLKLGGACAVLSVEIAAAIISYLMVHMSEHVPILRELY